MRALPSALLLALGCATAAAQPPADAGAPPTSPVDVGPPADAGATPAVPLAALGPIEEIARSRFGFRDVTATLSDGRAAVMWSKRGGVFVKVDAHPARMLYDASSHLGLAPAPDGFWSFATLGGPGHWREEARRLSMTGEPLEPARPVRHDYGDKPAQMLWTTGGGDLVLFVGSIHTPTTLWRVPVALGAPSRRLRFDLRPEAERGYGVPVAVNARDGDVEVVWRAGRWSEDGRPPVLMTRIGPDGAGRMHTARPDTPGRLAAWVRSRRPPADTVDDRAEPPRDVLGGPGAHTILTPVDVPRSGRLARHPDGYWLLTESVTRRVRRLTLEHLGPDGRPRGRALVVDADAGPSHERVAGHTRLVSDGRDAVAVWAVQDGRETLLRRRRISLPATASAAGP